MSRPSRVNSLISDRSPITVECSQRAELKAIQDRWNAFVNRFGYAGFAHRAEWGTVLYHSMGQKPYFLHAQRGDEITGVLPLAYVSSPLFGRFLVSLPYLNTAGVLSDCAESRSKLADAAVRLADALKVRHLELRQEEEIDHPQLTEKMTSKVHLRMPLPKTAEELMAGFKAKLRSQVKKALSNEQTLHWGQRELLNDYYAVFSRNMRDLGTPVFPKSLFAEMLRCFPNETEICVLRQQSQPVAAAFLLHGPGTTQVPSASTLREFNPTNANMRMYWHLLERAISRGQARFDFGRSSVESGTYKFKTQWGAEPEPAIWLTYRRDGQPSELRPENSKFQRLISLWQKLPVPIANCLGPWVVRGIP